MSCDNLNPTPNPTITPLMTMPLGEPSRVTILSWMPRDRQKLTTDNCTNPHQMETDGKTLHQWHVDEASDRQASSDEKIRHQSSADENNQVHDGNGPSRSTITGRLCKRVLAYIKWWSGADTDIDVTVIDSLGHWLCNRGISVYIDPV
jgi:hypothetical protein